MTYKSRIGALPTRSRVRLLTEGVASIDLNQRMTVSRQHFSKGSIAGDWKAVGKDVKRAVRYIKHELETA